MIFGPLVYPYPSNAIHAIIGRLRRPIWYVFHFPHASRATQICPVGRFACPVVMGLQLHRLFEAWWGVELRNGRGRSSRPVQGLASRGSVDFAEVGGLFAFVGNGEVGVVEFAE